MDLIEIYITFSIPFKHPFKNWTDAHAQIRLTEQLACLTSTPCTHTCMQRMLYLICAVSLPIVLQHYYCQGVDDDCRMIKRTITSMQW